MNRRLRAINHQSHCIYDTELVGLVTMLNSLECKLHFNIISYNQNTLTSFNSILLATYRKNVSRDFRADLAPVDRLEIDFHINGVDKELAFVSISGILQHLLASTYNSNYLLCLFYSQNHTSYFILNPEFRFDQLR